MKLLTITALFLIMALSACDFKITTAYASGELRRELFVECMELSAKMPRQSDDDVSDIVRRCTTTSYNLANQYQVGGETPPPKEATK